MRLLVLVLITLCASHTASAQSLWDYLARFELGIGHGSLNAERPPTQYEDPDSVELSTDYSGVMVSVGWNWPLVKLAPDLGLGVSASARLILSTRSEGDNDYSYYPALPSYDPNDLGQSGGGYSTHVNIPFYAMLKYGADATWGWRKPFGAAFGFGYQFVYHDPKLEYWAPFIAGEVSFASKLLRGVLKLQYHREITRTKYSTDVYDDGRTAQSWSAALLYSFNFGPRMKSESDTAS